MTREQNIEILEGRLKKLEIQLKKLKSEKKDFLEMIEVLKNKNISFNFRQQYFWTI